MFVTATASMTHSDKTLTVKEACSAVLARCTPGKNAS